MEIRKNQQTDKLIAVNAAHDEPWNNFTVDYPQF